MQLQYVILWNTGLAAAMALAVAVLSRFPPLRERPTLRHALWLLVLLRMVALPVLPLPILPAIEASQSESIPSTELAIGPNSAASAEFTSNQSAAAASINAIGWKRWNWRLMIPGLSVLGTIGLLLVAARRAKSLNRLLQQCQVADSRIDRIAAACARRMGVFPAPSTWLVATRHSPMLWACAGRPVVIFPRALVDQLSDDQLAWVISHELAHYVRRDHWSNCFAFCIVALCWWNPIVWWARRELRAAQELCCDALVIGHRQGVRRGYAETLFQVLEFTTADRTLLPIVGNAFGDDTSIRRRFEMIANQRLTHRLSWWAWPTLLIGAAVIPCLPVVGQADELNLRDCPQAVQDTIKRESHGGKIEAIEKLKDGEKTIFEVDALIGKHEYELHIAPDGILLHKVLEGITQENSQDEEGDDESHEEEGDDQEGDDEGDDEEEGDGDDEGDDEEEGDDEGGSDEEGDDDGEDDADDESDDESDDEGDDEEEMDDDGDGDGDGESNDEGVDEEEMDDAEEGDDEDEGDDEGDADKEGDDDSDEEGDDDGEADADDESDDESDDEGDDEEEMDDAEEGDDEASDDSDDADDESDDAADDSDDDSDDDDSDDDGEDDGEAEDDDGDGV